MKAQEGLDVVVNNHGTVYLFTAKTEAAHAWVEEKVEAGGYQWIGEDSFAVDARFARPLVEGMQADGLKVGP